MTPFFYDYGEQHNFFAVYYNIFYASAYYLHIRWMAVVPVQSYTVRHLMYGDGMSMAEWRFL